MNQIFTRKAAIEDLDEINEIFRLSKGSWGYSDEFMQQCMKDYRINTGHINENTMHLFYVDGHVAGFYNFTFDEDKHSVELDYFFLHPDYFGKGLGRKMWEKCLETAISLNIPKFILNADPNAEGFYLQMGCKKIGEQESPIIKNRKLPVLIYRMCSRYGN